jgi:hypothetical protein
MFQFTRSMHEHTALLLLMLLSADFVFIALHIVSQTTPFFNSLMFHIEHDNGFPEIYQYIKLFWIVILLIYVLRSTKCLGYVAWILIFGYFLGDDALKIHERTGEYIARYLTFAPSFNLKLQDLGELAVSATVGALLFGALAWAYLMGTPRFKKISNDILLFIAALLFFGVLLDMVHSATDLWPIPAFILGVIEDSGEMLVVSLMLCYVFLLAARKGDSDLFLRDLPAKTEPVVRSDAAAKEPGR